MKIPGCSFPPETLVLMGFAIAWLLNAFGRVFAFMGVLMKGKEPDFPLD